MSNIEEIEALLAAFEDIRGTSDNLAIIDGMERELTARLVYLDPEDLRTQQFDYPRQRHDERRQRPDRIRDSYPRGLRRLMCPLRPGR